MKSLAQPRNKNHQQGIFAILFAGMLVMLVGLAAVVVDLGFMHNAKAELQAATDAGALAGAGVLATGNSAAVSEADAFVGKNPILHNGTASNIQVQVGSWNSQTKTFTATNTSPNAVSVTATYSGPFYFAEIFNKHNYNVTATSVATMGPVQDVLFVQDTGGANSWSSTQGVANGVVPPPVAKQNEQNIYQSTGLPPQIGNISSSSHTCHGNTQSVINQLGVNNVPFPNPQQSGGCGGGNSGSNSGSWNDYINYVHTTPCVAAAGLKDNYCHQTLVDYWCSKQILPPTAPEQPLQGQKDTIGCIANKLTCSDTCGLKTLDGSADVPLTSNAPSVVQTANNQVCGSSQSSNVQSTIHNACGELQNNGRTGTQKSIVIVSAGQFPWVGPNGQCTNAAARTAALNECANAKAQGIKIHTVCLGTGGDTAFLQQAASMTGGKTYTVPTNSTDFTTTGQQIAQDMDIGNPVLVK